MNKEDFQIWKADPVTRLVMKYLKQFNSELKERHSELFMNGEYPSSENFYRDSERFRTIDDIVNLSYDDMEAFYDQTSVGQIDSQA
jgi:hypothetical protein